MKIDVESLMLVAAREGTQEYQPTFHGEELKIENAGPANSEANLNHLLGAGLTVSSIRVVASGVIVAFTGGESYLATGLAAGHAIDDPVNGGKTTALARFLTKVFSGTTVKRWHEALTRRPHDPTCEYVVDLRLYPDAHLKPRISR
jgi:hypothetical protein